jgi:hypothetical protein
VKFINPRADKVLVLEGNSRQPLIVAMGAGDLGGVGEHGMNGKGSTKEPGIS